MSSSVPNVLSSSVVNAALGSNLHSTLLFLYLAGKFFICHRVTYIDGSWYGFDRRLFCRIFCNNNNILYGNLMEWRHVVCSLTDHSGSNTSRKRKLITASLTALCAIIVGEIVTQWYYTAVITQQPTKMDMYIQYDVLSADGNGDLSAGMLNIFNDILIFGGNIIADGLMVRRWLNWQIWHM